MAGFLAGRDAKRAVVWVCCLLEPENESGRRSKSQGGNFHQMRRNARGLPFELFEGDQLPGVAVNVTGMEGPTWSDGHQQLRQTGPGFAEKRWGLFWVDGIWTSYASYALPVACPSGSSVCGDVSFVFNCAAPPTPTASFSSPRSSKQSSILPAFKREHRAFCETCNLHCYPPSGRRFVATTALPGAPPWRCLRWDGCCGGSFPEIEQKAGSPPDAGSSTSSSWKLKNRSF